MALSNTAVPKYYGMFRDAVIRGEIPVNKEISMERTVLMTLLQILEFITMTKQLRDLSYIAKMN